MPVSRLHLSPLPLIFSNSLEFAEYMRHWIDWQNSFLAQVHPYRYRNLFTLYVLYNDALVLLTFNFPMYVKGLRPVRTFQCVHPLASHSDMKLLFIIRRHTLHEKPFCRLGRSLSLRVHHFVFFDIFTLITFCKLLFDVYSGCFTFVNLLLAM